MREIISGDNRCARIYDLKQKIQYPPTDIGTYVLEEDIDLMDRVFVDDGKVSTIMTDTIENKLIMTSVKKRR